MRLKVLGILPNATYVGTLYSSDRVQGFADKGYSAVQSATRIGRSPVYVVIKMLILIQYLSQQWHHRPLYDSHAHDAGAMLRSPAS